MSSKEVALATARFLDSDPARSLVRRRGSKVADLRRVAEAFYDGCFAGLGKKPRLLEEHDLLELMGQLLPASFTGKEEVAKEVPLIVEAIVEELEESEVVPHAFELRRSLDEAGQRFLSGLGSSKAVRSTAPVVNKVDKLGRNDPCFCGSGRKFKKCCGKPS